MTAQEFLYDTVHHYNLNNRCVDDTQCAYSPLTIGKNNSEGCAIGRYLDPELAYQIDKERKGLNASINRVSELYSLPEWMKQLDIALLTEVQNLHDEEMYWDSDGLSEMGKRKVRNICDQFNLSYEQLNLN